MGRDPQPGVQVEAVGVLAFRPDAGVEVELVAAEPLAFRGAPVEQGAAMAASARLRQRGEVVHVERVAPGEGVEYAEARHRHDAPAPQRPDDPVALGTLLLVHPADELPLVAVVGAERSHRLEGERRVRRMDLPQSSS